MTKQSSSSPTTIPTTKDNLRLWDQLGKTDPAATKPITGKRFKGTAIKPMWINKRLTEVFGPAGVGWGVEEPRFESVRGDDGQVLVFCTVAGWYREAGDDRVARVYGVGGELVIKKESSGWFFDDEAYKKAFTDAIGNAFKFVGAAADVHMGLFDDSKYVQEMRQEYARQDDELGKEVDALEERIRECDDLDTLNGTILPDARSLKARLEKEKRAPEASRLITVFNARLARLKADAADLDVAAVADRDEQIARTE